MRKFHPFLLRLIVLAGCMCLLGFDFAFAGETSVGVNVAHGDESSQAYDFYIQHTFSPWYANDVLSLSPLVSAGVSLWERSDESLWGGNVNVGLVMRFVAGENWRPFIGGSFGLSVLSGEDFHDLELGCREQFRSRASIGVDFGEQFRHTVKCDLTHYSNGSMSRHNDGYNTVGLSYAFNF